MSKFAYGHIFQESKGILSDAGGGEGVSDPDVALMNRASARRLSSTDSEVSSKTVGKKTPDDFVFGKVIGEGSFSTVSGLVIYFIE